jgi:hypothetical protein
MSYQGISKEYLSGNKIKQGIVDTNDRISDKCNIARQKGIAYGVFGSCNHKIHH